MSNCRLAIGMACGCSPAARAGARTPLFSKIGTALQKLAVRPARRQLGPENVSAAPIRISSENG